MGAKPIISTKVRYKAFGAFCGEELHYLNAFSAAACRNEAVLQRGYAWSDLVQRGWTIEEVEVWFPDDRVDVVQA